MIEIKNVSLTLNKRQILTDLSLQLENGKIYGLAGNNGCGKTMLMKCICGFVKPTSGEIFSDGKQIGKDTDYLPDAGVIIETPGFISYYSGLKNLKVLTGIRNRITQAEIRTAMEEVGLDPNLKLPVKKYSLGMRQRLGLAQAIMEHPSALILDEPMNGLDKKGVAEIRSLLLSMKQQGRLILLASHNAEDIRILCDEVYEMDGGRITGSRSQTGNY
ncbi:MAG: ATP-binding cassette domain-containing protein [Clostridiales bacterium]|nr:ATP-binding cassette domain-containing protein [Clostridiales bacterium]